MRYINKGPKIGLKKPMKAETSKVKALTMKIQNEFWTNAGNICGLMRNGKAEIIGTNGWIKYENKWGMEKEEDFKDECGKRPITCLNTFYKITSAIVVRKLRTYVKRTGLYPVEQRGGIDGNMGFKELIVDEQYTKK